MKDQEQQPGRSTTLGPDEARRVVTDALHRIVPDADLDEIGDRTPFRGELELDSLDFLGFVERLSTTTGRRIEEADYPRLATVSSCVEFLTSVSR